MQTIIKNCVNNSITGEKRIYDEVKQRQTPMMRAVQSVFVSQLGMGLLCVNWYRR